MSWYRSFANRTKDLFTLIASFNIRGLSAVRPLIKTNLFTPSAAGGTASTDE
jgi:hypothetical protein